MSALVSGIKFRCLFDQLNRAERNQLFAKLKTKFGQDFICSLLFNSWSPNAKSIICDEEMNNIVEIVSDILRDNQRYVDNIDKIDMMTDHLIGEIASYLSENDYIHLSQANRAIFIGCNSPNRLEHLELGYCDEVYSGHDLSKYPSLKTLCVVLQRFDKLRLPSDGLILNNLSSICLNGPGYCPDDGTVRLQNFMAQKCITFDKIEMVGLQNFYHTSTVETIFWQLLLKFGEKNITNLQLHNIEVDELLSDQKLQTLLANLEQLSCSYVTHILVQKLLGLFGHKLTHLNLDLHGHSSESLRLESINFKRLNELVLMIPFEEACTGDNITKTCCNIMKTATALEKCKIDFGFIDVSAEPKCVQKTIAQVISTQNKLEYVEFSLRESEGILDDIFSGIELGLLMTKKVERNLFQIGISYDPIDLSIEQLLLYISRIKDKLDSSAINDYTFCCRLKDWEVNKKKLNTAIQEFQQFESDIIIRCAEDCEETISIALMNKSCKINGYSTSFSRQDSWFD